MSGELTTPIIAAEFATTGIILANQGDTTATTNLSLMDKEGKRVPKIRLSHNSGMTKLVIKQAGILIKN